MSEYLLNDVPFKTNVCIKGFIDVFKWHFTQDPSCTEIVLDDRNKNHTLNSLWYSKDSFPYQILWKYFNIFAYYYAEYDLFSVFMFHLDLIFILYGVYVTTYVSYVINFQCIFKGKNFLGLYFCRKTIGLLCILTFLNLFNFSL